MAQFMRPTEINFNSNKFGKRKKCEIFSWNQEEKKLSLFNPAYKLMTGGGRSSDCAPQMPIYDGKAHKSLSKEGETTSM